MTDAETTCCVQVLMARLDAFVLGELRKECRAAGLKASGNLLIVRGRVAAFKAGPCSHSRWHSWQYRNK